MSKQGNVIRRYSQNNTQPKSATFITGELSTIKKKQFKTPTPIKKLIVKRGGNQTPKNRGNK